MKLLTILFLTFDLLACQSLKRPDADACGINAVKGYKRCFNILHDYDNDGVLLPGHEAHIFPVNALKDLNANICVDPQGFEKIQTYAKELRTDYEDLRKRCGL
jgi:hypothetical protein